MHEYGHIREEHEENPIVYILEVLHATPNLKKYITAKMQEKISLIDF